MSMRTMNGHAQPGRRSSTRRATNPTAAVTLRATSTAIPGSSRRLPSADSTQRNRTLDWADGCLSSREREVDPQPGFHDVQVQRGAVELGDRADQAEAKAVARRGAAAFSTIEA